MFWNVSNHPSAKWSPSQLDAARNLGGVVVDVPFPNVDPRASTETVRDMARALVKALDVEATPAEGDELRYAMVQGEMTLTLAIIEEVRRFPRVRCVAATTERRTVENPDGTRTAAFDFVQFRRY